MGMQSSIVVTMTAVWWWGVVILSPKSIVAHKAALYIFGDSLYDGGMTLYNGVKGAGAEFWPYGETYFKKPAGRYSDGRLIPDFIAEYAGLPFLKPYLLPGLKSYTKGINFASAGACVLVETRPKTINMKMQVDYFREMVQKMRQEIGEVKAKNVVSKAVYMVNIGGNDYVELVNRNLHKLPLSPSHKNFYMKEVIANLATHIETIYNEGGRKFAFQNIGPMGCLPAMKFMLKFKGTCAQEPLSLARMHNAAFLVVLKKFESQLPGFKYTVYDFYSSLYLRVLYGKRYGFTNTLTACCGSGAYNGDFTCQKKGEFRVCKSPSDHLWFDAGHPTEKADQQFAKEFWSGSSNLVSPYNLKALFNLH